MKQRLVLAVTGVLGLVLATAVTTADPSYLGVEKCGKMCHKLQYTSWQQTGHAQATETAKGSSEWPFAPECLGCHATNGDEALGGVQCEACHGPGSDFKSIQIMKDREKAVAAGLVIPTQETCDRCHDGVEHHSPVGFTRDVHAHKN